MQVNKLLTDAKLGNDSTITLDVVLGDIVQQTTTLTDELEQAHAAVVVLLVHLQMLGELVDALGQDGDLDLRRAGVGLVGLVVGNDGSLLVLGNHGITLPFGFTRPSR